jgi:predicted MPP superfamily phosphohydrolase
VETRLIVTLLFAAFSSYAAANYYIFSHLKAAANSPGTFLLLLFWALAAISYPAGRLLEAYIVKNTLTWGMIWVGSYYLAFMVYAILLCLAVDIYRLLSYLFAAMPPLSTASRGGIWAIGSIAIIALVVAAGLNARRIQITKIELSMPGQGSTVREDMHIAAISDIHVGCFMRNSRIKELVDTINSLKPHTVWLAGDIVDESVYQAEEEKLAEEFSRLEAPYGVYAVTGNHEYYAGVEEVADYLRRGGVRLLRDEAVVVGDAILLVGRNDIRGSSFGDSRLPLKELLREVPPLPTFILDHTPLKLSEAEEAGVTMQISGHTHNGQLFPFNFITSLIFEKSWGLLQKGNTIYYISCGFGTWGPPTRLGSVPEIVFLTLKFVPSP